MVERTATAEALRFKRARLQALTARKPEAARSLDHWFDLEFAWSSAALAGGALSAAEAEQVIENGEAVGGRSLDDHLAVVDAYDAAIWLRSYAEGREPVDEAAVLELHRRSLARSRPESAGRYARLPRRIPGSLAQFPPPVLTPELTERLGAVLAALDPAGSPESAFRAHWWLAAIRPFEDGNGRTGRLLTNLLLLRGGWPPVSLRPADRLAYLAALDACHAEPDTGAPLVEFFAPKLNAALDDRLEALESSVEDAA